MLNVARSDTSHTDTSVSGKENGVLIGHDVALLRGQAGEGEHTDLVSDMVPVLDGSSVFQGLLEGLSHPNDTAGHDLDFVLPQLLERRVLEDGRHDAGSMQRRVGVGGSGADL